MLKKAETAYSLVCQSARPFADARTRPLFDDPTTIQVSPGFVATTRLACGTTDQFRRHVSSVLQECGKDLKYDGKNDAWKDQLETYLEDLTESFCKSSRVPLDTPMFVVSMNGYVTTRRELLSKRITLSETLVVADCHPPSVRELPIRVSPYFPALPLNLGPLDSGGCPRLMALPGDLPAEDLRLVCRKRRRTYRSIETGVPLCHEYKYTIGAAAFNDESVMRDTGYHYATRTIHRQDDSGMVAYIPINLICLFRIENDDHRTDPGRYSNGKVHQVNIAFHQESALAVEFTALRRDLNLTVDLSASLAQFRPTR